MIEDLSIEKLRNYGFSEVSIEGFNSYENSVAFIDNHPDGCYWASNSEKKIYSEIDGYRQNYLGSGDSIYFPINCVKIYPEYFFLKKLEFLEVQKKIAGPMFIIEKENDFFLQSEISTLNKFIEQQNKELSTTKINIHVNILSEKINRLRICLNWLENITDISSLTGDPDSIEDGNQKSHYQYIKRTLIEFNREPWSYFFESMQELDAFVTCLNRHFTGKKQITGKGSIKIKKGCMTKLGKALKPIYLKLTDQANLINDHVFFDAIRVLSSFKEKTDLEISKMM